MRALLYTFFMHFKSSFFSANSHVIEHLRSFEIFSIRTAKNNFFSWPSVLAPAPISMRAFVNNCRVFVETLDGAATLAKPTLDNNPLNYPLRSVSRFITWVII